MKNKDHPIVILIDRFHAIFEHRYRRFVDKNQGKTIEQLIETINEVNDKIKQQESDSSSDEEHEQLSDSESEDNKEQEVHN